MGTAFFRSRRRTKRKGDWRPSIGTQCPLSSRAVVTVGLWPKATFHETGRMWKLFKLNSLLILNCNTVLMLGEDSLKNLGFSQVIKYGRFEGKQFELLTVCLILNWMFHSLVFILSTSTLKPYAMAVAYFLVWESFKNEPSRYIYTFRIWQSLAFSWEDRNSPEQDVRFNINMWQIQT